MKTLKKTLRSLKKLTLTVSITEKQSQKLESDMLILDEFHLTQPVNFSFYKFSPNRWLLHIS